jgi:hypothetical protein
VTTSPTVVYIGGTGRTGSTTVDQLAGQIPGWFSAGEMGWFWELAVGENGRCPCGRSVPECEVWSAVLDQVANRRSHDASGDTQALAKRMTQSRRRFNSVHLPAMVLPGFTARRLAGMRDYLDTQRGLYEAIAEVTDAVVIVDSAKEPHYAFLLRDGVGLNVRFVHLVRDPRAVGFSWSRRKRESGLGGDREMESRGTLKTSVYYLVSNIASELLWRRHQDEYAFVRYEDFVADPNGVLTAVARFAGDNRNEAALPSPGPDGGWPLDAASTHTSWGNPDRIGRTSLKIREDTAWRDGLPATKAWLLTVLNLPLVWRYGYPLRPGGRVSAQPRSRRLRRATLRQSAR